MTVSDIIAHIEALAPPHTALDWDNVGLQLGAATDPCHALLICLEVTPAVADEAARLGADLIVAHHPLIFSPLTALRTDRPIGALIRRLLEDDACVYVAHTNLDAAPEVGTTAALAAALDIDRFRPLISEGEVHIGAVANLPERPSIDDLLALIRRRLQPARVTVVGETARSIETLALMPGSGGDAVGPAAGAGAGALICGDLKHHDALDALALGLTVIDATHYATERPVVAALAGYLRGRLPADLPVHESAVVTDPFAAPVPPENFSSGVSAHDA